MKARKALNMIQEYLMTSGTGWEVERDKQLGAVSVPVFARRKAGMAGRDFYFFHDADVLSTDLDVLKGLHEEARDHVNGFFKMPKAFRFKVPSIISVFVKTGGVSEDMKTWAGSPTRTVKGGEYHAVYTIDTDAWEAYGQGTSRAFVMVRGAPGFHMEFKKIDPQNRAHHLISDICGFLFPDD